MHMTTEALTIIEQDAALASGPMLNHYVELVRNGIQDVSQDVREHGEALLIKLAHLVRQQRGNPFPRPRNTWRRGSRLLNRSELRPDGRESRRWLATCITEPELGHSTPGRVEPSLSTTRKDVSYGKPQ